MRAALLLGAALLGCTYEGWLGRTPADAVSLDAAPEVMSEVVSDAPGDAAPLMLVREELANASYIGPGDRFGSSTALSADGSTLAVGAPDEDSAATGIGGNQGDDAAIDAGAVYILTSSGTTWNQKVYVKAFNTRASDRFGASVALSADGSTLAVGARHEDSASIEIDNSASSAGAVYVFTRSGTTWSQQGYLKAANAGRRDYFGTSVALSGDGSILAVGASGESGGANGVNGNFAADVPSSGAVYVFTRSSAAWVQDAYVKASNTGEDDSFGASIALSADGSTLAVGATSEDSSATGVNGGQVDDSAPGAGAVYVFTYSGVKWSQRAYVKASNTGGDDHFGHSVTLSGDGSTLAVGADGEASAATGVGGNQANDSAPGAGAVYVFTRSGETWGQRSYVKPSSTAMHDAFGHSVALSAGGEALAIGANLKNAGGAAYVFY
jgi:hypothetical protein